MPAELFPARQYFSAGYDDDDDGADSDKNVAVYLPLGPRYEFSEVLSESITPSASRGFLLNLIVSPTNPSRIKVAALLSELVEVRRKPTTTTTVGGGGGEAAAAESRATLFGRDVFIRVAT